MINLTYSLKEAQTLDQEDPLKKFRDEFVFPQTASGEKPLYFAGHSLGLMPRKAPEYVQEEMESWGRYGVEGHFEGKNPWLPYHENITGSFARLVGAQENEVVAMFKTSSIHRGKFQQRLIELHPADVPECILLDVLDGSPEYLNWVRSEVLLGNWRKPSEG